MLGLLSEVFRPPWPGSGLRGSVRARARVELREHLRTNPVLRQNRLRPSVRPLAAFLEGKRLSWFLWRYAVVAVLAVAAELSTARFLPQALPRWSEPDGNLWGFVKDADSYFLVAQATLIGLIFPIAVGMVTLIVQRQQASTTSAHIRIYYSESFAYGVGASGIALLMVLLVQVMWPLQFVAHRLGFGTSNMLFKLALLALHGGWLLINAAAIWHFLSVSLDFVQPEGRAALRNRYTARVSIPRTAYDDLMRTFYRLATAQIFPKADDNSMPSVAAEYAGMLGSNANVEASKDINGEGELVDVWMRPIYLALRLWWRRTVRLGLHKRRRHEQALVVFEPGMLTRHEGAVDLVSRIGGTPFTGFERWLLRVSFRFKRVRPR